MHIKDYYKAMTEKVDAMGMYITVLPDGNINSEIAIVGDFPRDREIAMKRPLVGEVGAKLWNTLKKHVPSVNRNTVYITHGVKRKVKKIGFTGNVRDIGANETASWSVLMDWELSLLANVHYVIAMGEYGLRAVLNEQGIKKWRGSVVKKTLKNGRKVQVLVVDAPTTGIEQPKEEIIFDFFIKKFKRLINGDYADHDIIYHINPTVSQALDWLRDMKHSATIKGNPLSYDIEVMANETACIGITDDAHEGMCINFKLDNGSAYSLHDEYKIRMKFQELFLNEKIKFVAQNGNFDATWLWFKDRIKVHRNWFDTLLAHHTLYNSLPHGLGFLTAQYTNLPYYKDEGDIYKLGGNIDAEWTYNIKDICSTLACQQKLEKELHDQHLDRFFYNHVMRIQPHLTKATVNGLLVDHTLKESIVEELTVEVDNLRSKFLNQARICTGDNEYSCNPNSSPQLKMLLFQHLHLVGRGTAADAKNRERVFKHPRTPESARQLITILNKYKEEHKFLSTYATTELDDDHCFRAEYRQFGVTSAPGRLSSAAPLWGTGGNAQNLPDRTNPMFIAPDGYCWVYFDLAQAEARYVAWEANIPKWKEDFEKARLDGVYDCHRALAADMFKIPYDDVPFKDRLSDGTPTIRFKAKRCRHGLNYRMEAGTLATSAGMTLFEAQQNYEIYHETTPELRIWWNSVIEEVKRNKNLFNAYGRRWTLMQKPSRDALDAVIAFKPQSSIGDHVQRTWYKSEDDTNWPLHAEIVRNVHDANYALCKINDRYKVARIMKQHAEFPMIVQGEELIIPADIKISEAGEDGIHRFSTLKDIKL